MTAVRRIRLVRHAGTAATRRGDFAVDEPLAEAGTTSAAGLARLLGDAQSVLCSPTARARETARAAGLEDPVDDPRLRPLDVGLWAGRSLLDVSGDDPAGAVRWLGDPAARPHGGETVVELIARVGALLAEWHDAAAPDLVAVTHAAVIRAAVVVALGAPAESFWRVEAAPASVTELHTRGTGWALFRINATYA
ncbi:MAG: hypothetical protein QOG49_730 [Frankiaceae bacterium]|jgi:broad specificity phosphatase PhoE|nr:hypothetical protein [Frankiaceae bacterium]